MEIMLDLETMGVGNDAAIIAIGAVAFDLDKLALTGQEFYHVISLESAMKAGGTVTPATILWWMQQGEEARAEFDRPGLDILDALSRFYRWVIVNTAANATMWGNGANFDNVILRTAYERLGLNLPWSFRNDRCFRTARALLPQVEIAEHGVKHNALEDARWQARYLIEATRVSRG